MTTNANDNICFDIISEDYDTVLRMQIVRETVDLKNVYGHMQDMLQSIQGLRESNSPSGKTIRYKVIVRSNKDVDTYLKDGVIMRVTKFRNKYTRNWETLAQPRDYMVSKINDMDSAGRFIALSLIDRGSDGPRT